MTQIKVREMPDCEYCGDEREYEVTTLGAYNEPRYYTQKCICTLADREYGDVPIDILTPLQGIKILTEVMNAMAIKAANEMVWFKGKILSTTLPSAFLAF